MPLKNILGSLPFFYACLVMTVVCYLSLTAEHRSNWRFLVLFVPPLFPVAAIVVALYSIKTHPIQSTLLIIGVLGAFAGLVCN